MRRYLVVNDAAATEIYTLSLHDALPICRIAGAVEHDIDGVLDARPRGGGDRQIQQLVRRLDRKSTRLNSSHVSISYAVFCSKKISTTLDYVSLRNIGINACLYFGSACLV